MIRTITRGALDAIPRVQILVSSAFFVAVPGATTRGTCEHRAATGATRRTGTSASVSGVPSEFVFCVLISVF